MRPTILSLLAVSILGSSLVQSQAVEPKRTTLTGTVVDPDGQPIAGAEVFVGDTKTPVVTNDQGRFRILDAPSRSIWIAARRIGYAPTRRSLTIRKGETREIQLVMERLPVRLPDVEVRKASGFGVGRLAEFWRRSRTGWGRFITRDVIERRHPTLLSQVVRSWLPFAALASWERTYLDDFAPGTSAGFATRRHRRCAPALSLNAGAVWEGLMVDDIPVSEVEAIEIYRPGLEIPIEFHYNARARSCGLVVLWTRS